MIKQWNVDRLQVQLFDDPRSLGKAAASLVAYILNDEIKTKNSARLILATGASQFEFLNALQAESIDWSRITVFHLDEYKNLPEAHPASFRKYLKERILDQVQPKSVHFIEGDANELPKMIKNYEALLKAAPIDLACIGIGENGHIAFNDPPVADFKDKHWVKVVELDPACRTQQLGEGWFDSFDDVPKEAITLTIPAIMASKRISCVVPDQRKAQAVYATLYGPISTQCPASILRRHDQAKLYLDSNSAALLT